MFLKFLFSVDIDAIEQETAAQSSCDLWFLERVCRLTASKIKSVITRRCDFPGLVQQLLYKEPPTHLPAFHWERMNEPKAVEMYEQKFPGRSVSKCGLVIHPAHKFIAASPDRRVHDPAFTPPHGLLEVKCPVATLELPEVAAGVKKGFCLQRTDDGKVALDRSHAYYYQVMCQLFCSGCSWCDFVVMCAGVIFVERIQYDAEFWEACLRKLKSFYMDYLVKELAYPHH